MWHNWQGETTWLTGWDHMIDRVGPHDRVRPHDLLRTSMTVSCIILFGDGCTGKFISYIHMYNNSRKYNYSVSVLSTPAQKVGKRMRTLCHARWEATPSRTCQRCPSLTCRKTNCWRFWTTPPSAAWTRWRHSTCPATTHWRMLDTTPCRRHHCPSVCSSSICTTAGWRHWMKTCLMICSI